MLLSPLQELHLWQAVLEQDETARQTLSFSGLAELAQQAFREMTGYGISLRQLRGDSSTDTQAFHAWSTALLSECRKLSCLPVAQLEAALANVLESGKLKLPDDIALLGFDRTTPSQDLLIASLRARNCRVHSVELLGGDVAASPPSIVCARTLDEEIACAARWIRQELLARPSQRIGVLVPSSAEMRDKIDSTFRAILAPSTMDIRAPETALPYEFSLGAAMVRLQPIRTALTLLRWLLGPIGEDDVSWLLVHGRFSSGSLDSRATLDRRFRERNFRLGGAISLTAFQQWMSRFGENFGSQKDSAGMGRTIHTLFATVRGNAVERTRSFAEWRELIEESLSAAEFHLLTPKTSEDYQLLQRWNAMLNDLSSLNAVAGPVRFSTALEKLEHMADNTLFALETRDAPVQVLGIPESAGLVFDAVWWMDAQASVWPPRGGVQPFIPWTLQRTARMPYADPVDDDAFAQRVTQRTLNAAGKVVVSFALQQSDAAAASARIPDREILLSPLVRQALPTTSIVAAEEFVSHPARTIAEKRMSLLENIHEEPVVPFLAGDVRGGVRFLEFQSACPFRAFAELRLGTRPLQEPAAGLDAAAQGTVAHRVLQKFWEEVASQKALLQGTPEEHRAILHRHIQAELREFAAHASEPWQATLLEIEAERIEDRLLLWLEQEKARPEFTVVQTEDTLEQTQLGGIGFQCRVDRIDATQHGQVLLDYKTGTVTANDCAGDRPDQPQLPAYAVLRGQRSADSTPIAGIAFAGLHPRKIDFTVIASMPSVFTRTPEKKSERGRSEATSLSQEEMQIQLAAWKATLTRLADDFRSGRAVVDPKKARETCTYCAQALLCRVGEAEAVAAAFGGEGNDGPGEDSHDN